MSVCTLDQISAALDTSDVSVKDQGGDGRHVRCVAPVASVLSVDSPVLRIAHQPGHPLAPCLSIDVVSPMFEGKSAVDRQRMVYKAIWQELQETVHAVDSMTTRAPSEV